MVMIDRPSYREDSSKIEVVRSSCVIAGPSFSNGVLKVRTCKARIHRKELLISQRQ